MALPARLRWGLLAVASGLIVLSLLAAPLFDVSAQPVLTILPESSTDSSFTFNVVGLDSNNVNLGPDNFPVGARVCNTGDETATNVVADFIWDSANTLSKSPPTKPVPSAPPRRGKSTSSTWFLRTATRSATSVWMGSRSRPAAR